MRQIQDMKSLEKILQWHSTLRARLIILLICIFGFAHHAWGNSLQATVDRTQIGENETVNLTVKYQGERVNSDPDFAGLSQQFDILQNNKSMQHSIINGRVSSSTEWHLTLAPKNTGQLLIPPFSLNRENSRPITISVSEASSNPMSGREDVFIETKINKTEGYVQEQLMLTYSLYYNRRVDQLDMPDLNLDSTRIEALPRVDYQKTVGQMTYGVSEFRYALFPDASGKLEIPSNLWSIRTTDQPNINRFSLGGGRYKIHRAKTDALSINILPKPSEYPANAYWLPARSVEISQDWSQNVSQFKVGEPITRTITITAEGASGEQLPEIIGNTDALTDFKFYPDKPKQESQLESQGVMGSRTESVAIVPNRAGELTLPAIVVHWWNTQDNRVETATLPEMKIQVTGSATATTVNPAASQQAILEELNRGVTSRESQSVAEASSAWIWSTIILLISNLVFVFLWLRKPPALPNKDAPGKTPLSESKTLRDIEDACKQQSAPNLERALLNWIKIHLPSQPRTLKSLSIYSHSDTLRQQIMGLERNLYGQQSTPIDFQAITKEMKNLQGLKSSTGAQKSLGDLYPT